MAERNIKEGGYQPAQDPPPLQNGPIPPEAVNPITGRPGQAPPQPAAPGQSPPGPHSDPARG